MSEHLRAHTSQVPALMRSGIWGGKLRFAYWVSSMMMVAIRSVRVTVGELFGRSLAH